MMSMLSAHNLSNLEVKVGPSPGEFHVHVDADCGPAEDFSFQADVELRLHVLVRREREHGQRWRVVFVRDLAHTPRTSDPCCNHHPSVFRGRPLHIQYRLLESTELKGKTQGQACHLESNGSSAGVWDNMTGVAELQPCSHR